MRDSYLYKIATLVGIFWCNILFADNYMLDGSQASAIQYKLFQKISPTSETVTLHLSYIIPESFESVTYSQKISNFQIKFSSNPAEEKKWTDARGNRIIEYSWKNPRIPIEAEISFEAQNVVALKSFVSQAPFPLKSQSADSKPYLISTRMVPADDRMIKQLASQLVGEVKTQYEAVHNILSWVVDHVNYVLDPEEFGALYALNTGRGNCQNFSHLAAALLRAQGIPVRIVNGVTLKEPYNIQMTDRILTLNMAQGRHSWIEIYFPDLGWMPFDPQQSELFVSNRFIRIEVGIDNEETMNDGLVRWTRTKGAQQELAFEEGIEAAFQSDRVSISGSRQKIGPQKILLMPVVQTLLMASEKPVVAEPEAFDPATIPDLKFTMPLISGNLEFPRNVNFAFTRILTQSDQNDTQQLNKNFLVETAEYVTGGYDFAQMFVLEKPVHLEKIGLALQKFGGQGKIILELRENDQGKPGRIAASSQAVDLQLLSAGKGYDWVDFDFANQALVLTPDRYWLTIIYTGSPIVNWFYSYGKPVGPVDGTLMKVKSRKDWSNTLSYEFNYRVIGKTTE